MGAGSQRWWARPYALVSVFRKDFVRVWLMIDPDDESQLVEAGFDDIGEHPAWLRWEYDSLGSSDFWKNYVGFDRPCSRSPELRFPLEEGLRPGQPFLVEVQTPCYWTNQDGEGESSIEVELLYVPPPRLTKKTATYFEKFVHDLQRDRMVREQQRVEQEFLARSDRAAMYLATDIFYSRGYIDDMEPPTGVRYTLSTEHPGGSLAMGEHRDGDWAAALQALLEDAAKKLPGLDSEFIRSLPQKSWYR